MTKQVPYALVVLLALASALPATGRMMQSSETMESMSAPVWSVDKAHSAVSFTVRHFFTPVTGTFSDYEIELAFDPENLDGSHINATIVATSVDTRNDRRDNDLRSESFFEVSTYPTITFESDSITMTGENEYVASGTLTMHGVSKSFDLPFTLLGVQEFEGQRAERMGKALAGFSSEATLSRTEFSVGSGNWASTAVVGDEVTVSITIEAKLR